MSDELVKRLRANTSWGDDRFAEAADRIAQLTADKRFIIEERDRTFALMLARAEKAEADNARLLKALTNAGSHLDKGLDKMAFNIIRRAALTGKDDT